MLERLVLFGANLDNIGPVRLYGRLFATIHLSPLAKIVDELCTTDAILLRT